MWRGGFYFLSAAVVDGGGGPGFCGSVEDGARSFHRYCADDGGTLRVCAGTAIFAEQGGALWRGLLCSESVCVGHRLHAQRFCGAASVRVFAAGGAGGAAALRRGRESPAVLGVGRGAVSRC